ncbi:CGNR zinc finger domain-containing protein [Amycolatopsis acidiphila]|uniref:CGNR zinc finger domain-containing protein n=1 Tax=Amycolatopsis acidiphila TaxID=715473 RepID=UPI001643EF5F|nr:CGNR zinc finger domain-containing protein [Amycolatopsis acidiphila]UIJ56978.1 CGNR zinc finger domain-containing protein [Amycolatopsis acidiphila]GHG54001.1 hypothetical protein GCM10017788_03290 [Amycolatopsis acidiphila]
MRENDFAWLCEFRETTYRLFSATLAGLRRAPEDVEALNAWAQAQPPRYELTPKGLSPTGGARAIAGEVARSAADLLSRTGQVRVRECEGERCTRIFVDASRAGNRRWCGMDECGNRVKAAHYRARKSQAASLEDSRSHSPPRPAAPTRDRGRTGRTPRPRAALQVDVLGRDSSGVLASPDMVNCSGWASPPWLA